MHTPRRNIYYQTAANFTLDTRTSDKLKIVHRGIDFRIVGISRNKFNLDFYDISVEQWGAVTQ